MYAALVVVTRPPRRAIGALLAARRAANAVAHAPGIEFARALQGARFRPDTRPPFVPGRVAVMMWSHREEALEEARRVLLTPFADAAVERWDVRLQATRVHGAWSGFTPPPSGAGLDSDEPMVAMISGVLKARYFPQFVRDNANVVKQLEAADGYLGGLGLADTPLTTTSFSCWRTAKASQAFAFAAGAHRDAYKIDRAEQRHATEFFVRFRPLHSEGDLDGRDPLAGVLSRPMHVAT